MVLAPSARPGLDVITRAVFWNQFLWTAGYALTSGAFLTFFFKELGAEPFAISVILVVPEMFGIAAFLARPLILRTQSRRHVWLVGTIASRVVLLCIPALALVDAPPETVRWGMIGLLAITSAVQAIAYVSFVSWIADLAPEQAWGRFFARENIARVVAVAIVPIAGGYLRDWWRGFAPELALVAYVAAFCIGAAVTLCSLLPMLPFSDTPLRSGSFRLPEWRLLQRSWRRPSLRFLLIHNWWLAAANGLTQAAFFSYLYALGLGLGTSYVLTGVMNVLMVPVSLIAGRACDRGGNKAPLFWGLFVASNALPFWMLATPENWQWLLVAHAMWSGFAAANIAGRNLLLKLAPRGDNTAELTLFRQVGGLIAGLSGLAGGLWLQSLQDAGFSWTVGSWTLGAFEVIFLASWAGRLTSLLWILPIREPRSGPAAESPLRETF